MPRTGIVLVPMIFGISAHNHFIAWLLRRRGYVVKIVDFYRGQEKQWRFWISILRHGEPGLIEQTNRIDDRLATRNVIQAVKELQDTCSNVVLVGESLGGTYALAAATELNLPVVAISPMLVYPQGVADKANPDLGGLTSSQALILFAGSEEAEPTFLPSIIRARASLAQTELFGTRTTPHAAQSAFVQGWWPSIKFRLSAALNCWRRVFRFVTSH